MQAQVEELGDSKVRLTVEVPIADVKHAVEHAASDLADTAKIPGFRKGKVPFAVLVNRIGKERLYAEAVDSHIGNWFWNAAAQTRIRPVEQPEYGYALPSDSDSPWEFTATVAVQPKPDLPGLERRSRSRSPSRRCRTSSSTRRCTSFRRPRPISRRPTTAPRNPATCSSSTSSCPDDARRDYGVELGGGRLAPELETTLVGMSAGATASVEIPVSENETSTVE